MFRRAEQRGVPTEGSGPATASAVARPDRQRLEQMFRAHHEMLWRTLRRRGLPADAAADTAQQAFVIAAERLRDIDRGSERAFLVGTALRLARSAARRARVVALDEEMALHTGRAQILADDRATIDLLDLALSKIDPELIEVFVLFELEGFSSPEIARLVDIPVGTVASRLRRAREEFRAVARRIELILGREGKDP